MVEHLPLHFDLPAGIFSRRLSTHKTPHIRNLMMVCMAQWHSVIIQRNLQEFDPLSRTNPWPRSEAWVYEERLCGLHFTHTAWRVRDIVLRTCEMLQRQHPSDQSKPHLTCFTTCMSRYTLVGISTASSHTYHVFVILLTSLTWVLTCFTRI